MRRYADTVMVNGQPVDVTIDAPEGVNVMNLQDLAEKAWRSVKKEITVGGDTVKGPRLWQGLRLRKLLLVNHR